MFSQSKFPVQLTFNNFHAAEEGVFVVSSLLSEMTDFDLQAGCNSGRSSQATAASAPLPERSEGTRASMHAASFTPTVIDLNAQ